MALVAPALGLPSASAYDVSEYEVFEKIRQIPEGWRETDIPVDPSSTIDMRIHMAQQNKKEFTKQFLDISTPGHELYGQHMSREQIKLMLQPTDDTVSKLLAWLEANNLRERATVDADWVNVAITVEEAENLLQTRYSYYENPATDSTVLRTLTVMVPKEMVGAIDLIQPTTFFGFKPQKSTIHSIKKVESDSLHSAAAVPASCNTTITPTCLAELYNFADYTPSGLGSVGVSGYLEQFAQHSDLQAFLAKYAPSKVGRNFSTVLINGGLNTQLGSGGDPNAVAEANLDIQYTVGLNSPVPNTFFSTGGRPPIIHDLDEPTGNSNEPYLNQLQFLLNLSDSDLPKILTTSYGESEQTVPLSYRTVVCDLFSELGARGVSIFFSSGDEGPGASCISNDGTNTTKFLPTFPAACPWVTAVGATVFVDPEQAVGFSSGGFSDTYARPDYQEEAVQAFFDNHPDSWEPFADFFNKTGRAFPDVSAMGDNLRVILIGNDFSIGGTSASAPTTAAIFSLVNDFRLANGKKVLGFLNPLIYQNADAFTDIVKGRSTGCSGNIPGSGFVPNAGWDAVSGWDASTGFGTPLFDKFIKIK
jgi:tripeptidyl-peptidase-1